MDGWREEILLINKPKQFLPPIAFFSIFLLLTDYIDIILVLANK